MRRIIEYKPELMLKHHCHTLTTLIFLFADSHFVHLIEMKVQNQTKELGQMIAW
jgi:hypothetical protein